MIQTGGNMGGSALLTGGQMQRRRLAAAGPVRYDFAADTIGEIPSGWTAYGADATGWSVAADGSASGGKVVFFDAVSGGDGSARLEFTALGQRADWDITARLRPTVAGTNRIQAGIYIRGAGTGSTNSCYSLTFVVASGVGDNVTLRQMTNAQIGTVIASIPFGWISTWYRLRLAAVGTTIMAKVWADADPEPASWDVSVSDSAHSAGYIGFITPQHNDDAWWDWIEVNPL